MRPPHTAKRGSSQPTVADLGERALIQRISGVSSTGPAAAWVVTGIGDDAAALEPDRGALTIVTTDSLIEDVHFRRTWSPPGTIGYKALAVNLSDLAAMGARPRGCLLSLALPDDLTVDDFDAMVGGFVELTTAARCPLVGGNITRSPGPLVIDVTVLGAVRRRRMLTRSGGRPGDELYVTGRIGAAAAGLRLAAATPVRDALDAIALDSLERYERPEPRLKCGHVVAAVRGATACIDLSDGLADGARQIAEASGTGAVIDAGALPLHPEISRGEDESPDPVALALSGGEDYELLFAVAPRRRRTFLAAVARCRGLGVTRIGTLMKEAGCWLERDGERNPLVGGFEHFGQR